MVGIIDYGMGNLASVQKAVHQIGLESIISNNPAELAGCKYLILPGVGSYKQAISNIREAGLFDFIRDFAIGQKKPFLGICLGMQLLSEEGTEDGDTQGLGLIEGKVIRIAENGLPVPHIGWNEITTTQSHPIFRDIKDRNFYHVHSYHFVLKNQDDLLATVDYGHPLSAVVHKNNVIGVQFHPEKSQTSGLLLLKNFFEYYA